MAETLLLTIKERINQFSNTQKKIATYILNHAELITNMTTKELANKSGVSEESINRILKTIEKELAVSEEYITDFSMVHKKDSPYELSQKVIHVNKSAIESLAGSLNKKELENAVEMLKIARKIVFYGVGGSAIAATDALYK